MTNQVYANTLEVSCKAAEGKSICAFPDVCFTPPQTPATPPGVPIPYPNTGFASDCTEGSRTVQISGQEVMLKNKSYFKKSTGDEAGSAPKKGVITSQITGKCYFIKWSMDVMIEGENVVRTTDLTTHNHASDPANTPPQVYFDGVAVSVPEVCREQAAKTNQACQGATRRPPVSSRNDGMDCSDECKSQQSCILVPKRLDKTVCCHPDITGHHLIEDHWVKGNPNFSWYRSNRGGGGWDGNFVKQSLELTQAERDAGVATIDDAPCVCANDDRYEEAHESMHDVQGFLEAAYLPATRSRAAGLLHESGHAGNGFTYGDGKRIALNAHDATYSSEKPDGPCDRECLEAQLDAFYDTPNDTPLNPPTRLQPGRAASRTVTQKSWSGVIKGPR